MNKFLSNVLIVLALALCALCAWQWVVQTHQSTEIFGLTDVIYRKDEAIQKYTNSLHLSDVKIAQLDEQVRDLRNTVKTNEATILQQKRDIAKMEFTTVGLTNQVEEYKQALDAVQNRLKEAYAGIEKQNQVLKEVVAQRDDYISKLNDSTKERNDIVAKYNELVKTAEKMQEEITKLAQAKQPPPQSPRGTTR